MKQERIIELKAADQNASWWHALRLLRTTLDFARIPKRVLVLPIILSLLASLCEGATMALLIPMIQTMLVGTVPESLRRYSAEWFGERYSDLFTAQSFTVGLFLVALTFSTVMVKIAGSYGASLLTTKQIKQFAHNLRVLLFQRYLSFGKAFFDRGNVGAHQQVLTTYVNSVALSLSSLHGAFYAFCTVGVYVTILMMTSWRLTVVVLCTLPLLQLGLRRLIRKIEASSHVHLLALDQIGKKIANSLTTIPLVKACAQEKEELRSFEHCSSMVYHFDYSIEKKALLVSPLQESLMMGVLFGLVIIMALVNTEVGAAATASAMVYLLVLKRLVSIVGMVNGIKGSIASAAGPMAEIINVLDDQGKHLNEEGVVPAAPLERGIELRGVSFCYPDGVVALKKVHFVITKGEVTALVGPSGAGKSTIAQLLMRFYDGYSGEILVDGIELGAVQRDSWLTQIAWVSQETLLLDDTLLNNLVYGLNREVEKEELQSAIDRARLGEVVARLPQGINSVLGERGVTLSGGERQRVAIARALLRNAELLIFDEATSALDYETEAQIQEALVEVMRDRTTLIIAHRLSTVRSADKVIVLEKGEVVEEGTPQTLFAAGTRFHHLWQTHTKELFV